MLDNALHLTEKGVKDLKKAVIACVITNLTQFLPFIIIMQIMRVIIAPISGDGPLGVGRLWILFGLGVLAAILYGVAYGAEYERTYAAAYGESTAIRVEAAEHMRKLPMSFFNRRDLSELTTNIMGDCTTIEEMMSHLVPQAVGNCATITLVCLLLAFYDWRMAAALYCTFPLSIGIIAGGRKIQAVLGERRVRAKLGVSGQVQEYLDGIKVVKAFGLAGEKFTALETSLREMMREAMAFEVVVGAFTVAAMMVLQVGVGIVVLAGTYLLTKGSLDAIVFLTFIVIAARIYAPIGKKDASDDEIYRAAKLARCDDFIRAMPRGYETLIGENGSTLSGGSVREFRSPARC
jgi:ATP-binding cassette subfamily B protein